MQKYVLVGHDELDRITNSYYSNAYRIYPVFSVDLAFWD